MFIDGAWHAARSGRTFEVTDPATGEVIGSVADGGADDARDAIAAADSAFGGWSTTTAHQRADLLYRAHQLMTARSDELARLMTREQGKPIRASRAEVTYAADFLRFYAEEATRITGEWLPSPRPDQRFLVLHQPVGVVAMVTPWNYPISMLTRKMAPALAAGCTLVLKPAEATPLCARAVFEIFEEAATPPGVINLVTALDPAPIGEVFTTDPRVRKLTFTGSTAVGRYLAGVAAGNLKRVSVELGGHAPFIVFPDADPVRAAKGAAALKFLNAGQACISPNRLYVSAAHEDAFVTTLVERVAKVQPGNGFDDGVGVGPLVNEAAVAKVADQVDDAVALGAAALVGGHRLTGVPFERGHFYAPTLLTGVRDGMKIYREETFGPVAPVITYDDVDQVLALANDTNYGLAAYVYTQDFATAIRAFEGLRFGIVGVNDVNPTAASAPFGGMKDSGLGREGSREGIAEYLETKLGGFAIGTDATSERTTMITPRLVPLVELRVTVDPPIEVGDLPDGYRRVIPITGGDFAGDRLRGEVLAGGADWNTIRRDDTMHFWARYTLRTDDGVAIGVIHEAYHPNVSAALPGLGAGTDPGDAWRARGVPRFEAPAGTYAWLNDLVCVSAIRPPVEAGQVRIDVFEVA